MKKSEVGYKKPPVATRWKPGQSGNPSGRPKKTVQRATAQQNVNLMQAMDAATRRIALLEAHLRDAEKTIVAEREKNHGIQIPALREQYNLRLDKLRDELNRVEESKKTALHDAKTKLNEAKKALDDVLPIARRLQVERDQARQLCDEMRRKINPLPWETGE